VHWEIDDHVPYVLPEVAALRCFQCVLVLPPNVVERGQEARVSRQC
jgi:hypothetical protein